MIGAFYRFWLACAVVAVSGVVHAFWVAPEVWEGVRTARAQVGSVGLWDYLRMAAVLLPGLGLIVLWERSQKPREAPIVVNRMEPVRQEDIEQEEEQVAQPEAA